MTRNSLNEKLLLALTLDRDDKLDLRLCASLKRELKAEYRRFGFSTLSDYVIAILASRSSRFDKDVRFVKEGEDE